MSQPRARLPEHWDDGLMDAVAMVEAQRSEDTAGIAVLLRHGNPFAVAVVLSKLLSVVLAEQDIPPAHFRAWASLAERRP